MASKTAYLWSFFLMLIPFFESRAQSLSEEKDRQVEQVLESMGESESGEEEDSQILDDLVRFSENPLNINSAGVSELEQLHLLDNRQIRDILDYRKKYGFLLSGYELNSIKSLTPGVIASLTPFLSFDQPDTLNSKKRAHQRLILRAKTSLPVAKGYTASEKKSVAYPGFPVSLYSRYHFEIPQKLQLGWIADQDAGEEFFKGSNRKGFDYYSGFLSWQSNSFIQQVTIGDYYLKFGQGLNFWSGSGIGKSSNAVNILRTDQGIRPYTAADENLYFRGIATVLGKGPVKLMLFYSHKARDANLSVDKATGDTVFTSLKTGGYHRTRAEIEDEDAITEQELGGYAEWRGNNFRVGGLFAHQQFNLNMIKGTSAYKAKSFSGSENTNMGLDYQLALSRIQLFGEAALSLNQKPAFIQGMIWHAHPQLNLSISYRYFDPEFHSFYGNPISEGSEARNEKGLYTGLEIYPFKKIKITGYADIYHFPFLTYSTTAPSSGRDFLIQMESSLSKKFYFYLRGKFETKPQKYTKGPEDPFDFDESVNKVRLHTEWKTSEKFSVRNRFEYVNYSFYQTSETGYLLYQDLEFTLFRKLNLWTRYCYFHTNGYNSRIYTYENDLLYSFSFPEFHGTGHRIYLNLRWQPSRKLAFYLKAGRTIHSGAEAWGSGNDQTSGDTRTEVRGEVCLRI